MKRALIIRKGVSLERLTEFIRFIDNYKGGLLKAIYTDEKTSNIEEFTKNLTSKDVALLFLGSESSNSKFEEEIRQTQKLGLRRTAFTMDEKNFPVFTPTGIPFTWKIGYSNYLQKATPSNILRAIVGATKWGI